MSEYNSTVQERVDVLDIYEWDKEAEEFDILHLYPGELCYPADAHDANGFVDCRFFRLIAYNTKTVKKRDYGEHDRMYLENIPSAFYKSPPLIHSIGIFADGSTLIKFCAPATLGWGQAINVHGGRRESE